LCPRNDESAGKRRSARLRKGVPWLKTLLVHCAWAAGRKKGYFNAQFLRLRGRRGAKKAACAVAASILTTIYHMLKDGTQFEDLRADYFDRRSTELRAKRLVAQSLQTLASRPSSRPSLKRLEIMVMLQSKWRSSRFHLSPAWGTAGSRGASPSRSLSFL
jgi:hypothetical protein